MPPQRRRLLVRTAAREFASAGYERASLNRIIKACGLSKSSFYHVIASKRDLFDLTIRDLTDALTATTHIPRPADFAKDFWPNAERLFEELAATAQHNESFVALGRMFYLSGTPDDARNAVAETLASIEAWLRDVLVAGRISAAVRDDLPVSLQSRLVFAVLRTLDEWTLANSDTLSPHEISLLLRAELATIRRILEPER